MQFARDAFVSTYLDAVRQNPRIVVSQFAYLLAVTGNNGSDKSEFERAAISIPFNEQLSKIGNYLPQVGIGVGLSAPLGSSPISVNLSASYNLNPLIASVFRGVSGIMSPEEVENTIRSISYMEPSSIAALGRLTWDAWQNTGNLQSLHSMYGIISQYTSQVPSPDSPPSTYIENSSPFVAPFFHELSAQPGVNLTMIRQDWDAFLDALPRGIAATKDVEFGNSAVREVAKIVASSSETMQTPLLLGVLSRSSAEPSFSLDPKLDATIRDWFAERAKHEIHDKRSYSEIQNEWVEAQRLLYEATAIASSLNDSGSQRAVAVTEQMLKLAYSVEMLNSAQNTLQSSTAGLGIVGAALSLFDMLEKVTAPDSPSAQKILLGGQQKILQALSEVSTHIHEVAVAVACVQRQVDSLQFAISTDFTINRQELRAIQASLAANRVDLLDALANSDLSSSIHAAEALRNDAQTSEVVLALKSRQYQALQHLNANTAVLVSDLGRLPFISPILVPTSLSDATPDGIFARPWNFTQAVADNIISSADYYDIGRGTPGRPIKVPESALSALKKLEDTISAFKNSDNSVKALGLGPFANLDTFYFLLVLMTDAVTRYPKDVSVLLDIDSIVRGRKYFDTTLESIVGSEAIINYALDGDLKQLSKHWDAMVLSLINTLYPISGAGGLSDRQLLNTLISEPAYVFTSVVRCAVDPENKCTSEDKQSASKKLIGMNLAVPAEDYYFYDLSYSGIPNSNTVDINACSNFGVGLRWSAFAMAQYPDDVKLSPDGALTTYRHVCATFRFEHGDPDVSNYWARRSYEEWKAIAPGLGRKIIARYLKDAILTGNANISDIEIKGEHRRRLELSANAATALVSRERLRVDQKFHEMIAGQSKQLGDLKSSIDDVLKDTATLQFIALLSDRSCFHKTADSQLLHLVSVDENGKPIFLAKKILDDLVAKGIGASGVEINKLLETTVSDYIQTRPDCYVAPAKLSDSLQLIKILEARRQ